MMRSLALLLFLTGIKAAAVLVGLTVVTGAAIGVWPSPFEVAAVACACAFAYGLNRLRDGVRDEVNWGAWKLEVVSRRAPLLGVTVAFGVTSAALALSHLAAVQLALWSFCILAGLLYSLPCVRIRGGWKPLGHLGAIKPWLVGLVWTVAGVAVPYLPSLLVGELSSISFAIAAGTSFVLISTNAIAGDCVDETGDRVAGVYTLAVRFGTTQVLGACAATMAVLTGIHVVLALTVAPPWSLMAGLSALSLLVVIRKRVIVTGRVRLHGQSHRAKRRAGVVRHGS